MSQNRLDRDNRVAMRRDDRARADEWIREMMLRAPYCHIATVEGDQPFITPMSFVYDAAEHAMYFHTAAEGRIRANADGGSRVCVSVAEMGRLLPAKTARGFSVEYRSVIAFGRISIIEEPGKATAAMQMLIDRYFPHLEPGSGYRPIQPAEIDEISVFRIDIEAWSGKEKRAEAGFAGAFDWKGFDA